MPTWTKFGIILTSVVEATGSCYTNSVRTWTDLFSWNSWWHFREHWIRNHPPKMVRIIFKDWSVQVNLLKNKTKKNIPINANRIIRDWRKEVVWHFEIVGPRNWVGSSIPSIYGPVSTYFRGLFFHQRTNQTFIKIVH